MSEDIALTAHLKRRVGFGATYPELEEYASRGCGATLEELLNPERSPRAPVPVDQGPCLLI